EDETLAVRRPRRAAVLEVAARELQGLTPADVDDEHVLAPVRREADAVELVEDAGDPPRRARALVLLLVRLVAGARGERDARRVGRPLDVLHALLQLREPPGLAPLGGNEIDVRRRLLVAAVRGEGEPPAVRRPARHHVAPLTRSELAWLGGAVERRHPDRASVLVRLLIERRDGVAHERAVRRDARVARVNELVDVLGLHPGHDAGL